MIFLISLLVIFLTAAGQIFLKLGAGRATKSRFFNGYVLFGYILFLLTIMFSYYLMKVVPMKYFTVLMSLNYITVMFAASIFLGEKINKNKLIGTIFIASGVFVFLMK